MYDRNAGKQKTYFIIAVITILLSFSMYYSSWDKYVNFTLEANNDTMFDSSGEGRETYVFDLQPGSYRFTLLASGYGTFSLYSPQYGSQDNEPGRDFAKTAVSSAGAVETVLTYTGNDVIRGARLRVTGDTQIYWVTGESVGMAYYDQLVIAALILLCGVAALLYVRKTYEDFYYDPTRVIHVLGLIIAALISTMALFRHSLQYAHDISFHLVRIEGVYESLKAGQFPPRMDMTFIKGYGYADQIMYPTLFLYIPAALRLMRVSSISSYQIFMLVINTATAGISYYAFTKLLKSRHLGFIAASAYTLCAYRLICVFTRSSIGELSAMAFLPLAVYGMYALFYEEKPSILPAVIGFTGIVNSHVVSLDMAVVISGAAFFINFRKLVKERRIGRIALAAGITILLGAWVLLPLYQMGNTGMRITMGEQYNSADDAVYPFELFAMFISSMGLSEPLDKPYTAMPLTVGLIFGLALLAFWGMRIYGKRHSPGGARLGRLNEYDDLAVRFSILAVIALYLTSTLFPWSIIAKIPYLGRVFTAVQFPWRYLGIASISLALVYTVTFNKITSRMKHYAAALTALTIMIVSAAPYIDNYMQDSSRPAHLADKWTRLDTTYIGGWEYLYLNCYKTWFEDQPRIINVKEGYAEISNLVVRGARTSFDVAAGASGSLIIPNIAYPGYRVSINGQEIMTYGFAKDFGDEYKNQVDNGLILLPVYNDPGGGSARYDIEWVSPASWRVSEIVSLITALCLILYFVLRRRGIESFGLKRPKRHTQKSLYSV